MGRRTPTPPRSPQRREDEQREAARRLGGDAAGSVAFLRYVDGELAVTREATSRIARLIRELQPEVVLGHDPWKRYRLHPDHRHAGTLTCDAVVAARDPHFFPEHGLPPHRPRALLLWEADVPNHVEDASGFVDRKLDALEAHASQFESTMKAVDAEQLAAFRTRIRERLAGLGEPYGLAAAELFARDLGPLNAGRERGRVVTLPRRSDPEIRITFFAAAFLAGAFLAAAFLAGAFLAGAFLAAAFLAGAFFAAAFLAGAFLAAAFLAGAFFAAAFLAGAFLAAAFFAGAFFAAAFFAAIGVLTSSR